MARNSKPALTHPVYLDTPMLLSFIATLNDGVTLGRDVTEIDGKTTSTNLASQGEGGTEGVLSLFGLKMNASGELSRATEKDKSIEQTFTRQHTTSSLFSLLIHSLTEAQAIKSDPAVTDLSPGDVVSFDGQILENPLEIILNTMDNLIPYVDMVMPERPAANRNQRRNMSPEEARALEEAAANREGLESVRKMADVLKTDQHSSPVVDLICEASAFGAIITANREYFTAASRESIIGGTFKVVGKVTSVHAAPGSSVSVIRRGAASQLSDLVLVLTEMISSMNTMLSTPTPEVVLDGPSIQILPLAIYI